MSKKISLNPKYTNNSGNSWSTTTYNGLEYYVSTNKYHSTGSSLKCEFTTPYDNIDVVIEIGSSSEKSFDWCYVGNLDNSSPSYNSNYLDRISGRESNDNPLFKKVTINVAKAGTHFLIIGYIKDGSGSYGNDCGYFRLVTTEVGSMEPTKYIYCGTKTTVVSEEPIKFTKTNVSYGNEGQRNWSEYQGSNKDYLWETSTGDSGYKTAKISFTTLSDNTILTLKYYVYWRFTDEEFTVSELDSTKLFVSEYGPCNKKVTKEITVSKAGEHFITIGYKSAYFSGTYVYVGFFGTNVVKNVKTLVPERILANNRNIDEVYVGSELIWSKPLHNTISWETLTWNKSNNSYTYNTKGKLYISYSYDNNNYGAYLLSSPASVPHKDKITKVKFYNINSYQGNSYNCTYKLDLSWVNTYKFNSMDNMFYKCSSLTNIDLSNFNTSNVTNMNGMFYNCSYLNNLDVSNFNTSNVTNMGLMFYGCSSLTSLDLSKWDTSKVTSMEYMFNKCSSLTSLDVSKLDTSKVTNMKYMFNNCNKATSLDVSKWNTSNVTSITSMFSNCNKLTSLDVSKWDTSNVTSMHSMFSGCNNLTSLDVSNFNTSKVTSIDSMFDYCRALTSLDVSKWDTSNVTSMYSMFSGCNNLTSLDVSNFNTSKVTNMNFMFTNCSNLTSLDVSTSLDLSKWDTSKVTSMQYMFFGCSSLTKLDLSKWNVSNVTNINSILDYCSSLTTLIDGHESDSYLEALNKLKVNIDLHYCVKLNYESVYAVFNGLAAVTGKTITLPKVMEGKLDADKVKIATDKGWKIAYK